MVVMVELEARRREGLQPTGVRANEGDTLDLPLWGLLRGLRHPAMVAEGWPCHSGLGPLRTGSAGLGKDDCSCAHLTCPNR